MRSRISILFCLLVVTSVAQAQIQLGKGQFSGSLESNSVYYVEDSGNLNGTTPEDRFGSNNHLKLDYTIGRFSAGVQLDAYLPLLQGYDMGENYRHVNLGSKYIQWVDKSFSVLVGDIFDQYGNGLIYRSFEDRQLGFNNSIEGVRASYKIKNYVEINGMYGRPRLYTSYANSWVRGANLKVSISDICKQDSFQLSIEGNYVNRYQKVSDSEELGLNELGIKPNTDMVSACLNLDWNGLSFRGEYVTKSKDFVSMLKPAQSGEAWYAEAGYNYKGLSITATYRQLRYMGTVLSYYGNGVGNQLNYLPALTRQYTYMLANLNPYQVVVEGEVGGQFDINYTLRSKEKRYKYWNFHANFSTFYTLPSNMGGVAKANLLWRDINFDVERQWDKKWKTSLLYSFQEWNGSRGAGERTYVANIMVADVTYKINKKHSLRAELQYLLTGESVDEHNEYIGDWIAALIEYNFAPHWSIYGSVMSQLEKNEANESKPVTYFGAGVSYTKSRTRIQLSYGRNRAGYICSGGVCRYQPAYTGANLMITTSF